MKIDEILNKLAALTKNVQAYQQRTKDSTEELADQPDDLFIPPLQLKLELLKKGVGVKSVYDEETEAEAADKHSFGELELMKKRAGIAAVINDEAASDEPFDG